MLFECRYVNHWITAEWQRIVKKWIIRWLVMWIMCLSIVCWRLTLSDTCTLSRWIGRNFSLFMAVVVGACACVCVCVEHRLNVQKNLRSRAHMNRAVNRVAHLESGGLFFTWHSFCRITHLWQSLNKWQLVRPKEIARNSMGLALAYCLAFAHTESIMDRSKWFFKTKSSIVFASSDFVSETSDSSHFKLNGKDVLNIRSKWFVTR